jgi:tRNA threonylcarbamoyl adenosine modification protein YeaZ
VVAPDGPALGIETAANDVSLALLDGERVLAEREWRTDRTLSQELLAGIDALLTDADVRREQIASIAVDIGPGGYTGLRIGVATAQGLALGLDVPLAGVGRFEIDAWQHLADAGSPVVAVHDAGRGRIAWAAYEDGGDGSPPVTLVAPRQDGAESCAREAPAGATWCGEVGEELIEARDAAGRSGDTDAKQSRRSAANLVRLARLHEEYGDPATVDVLYLRPPPITKPG